MNLLAIDPGNEKSATWKLNRTKQCVLCPWRKDVNPRDIPRGYSEDKHLALESTIAKGLSFGSNVMKVMACHDEHDAHCIGWLVNQFGPGNNLPLRMQMRHCENGGDIETVGEQHKTFEDTLP